MKISIIIPVYNVEKYISECIESILKQTYKDFELLLINDGSTDTSGIICDKYAQLDKRVHVFHKRNEGVSKARNLGIEYATGEWICFIDSDDWILSNYLETIINDTNIADLTFWGFQLHYANTLQTEYKPLDRFFNERKAIEDCLAYLKHNNQHFEYLGYTVNKLFKASIIKEHHIRFIDNLSIREDEVFTLSYARYISSIRVKSSPLYNYRILQTGLSHKTKSKQEYLSLIKELNEVLQYYHGSNLLLAEENSILNYYFQALITDIPFSKSWFILLNNLIEKGRFLQKKNSIYNNSRKMKLIFRYNFKLYSYIVTILINIIYRVKKKVSSQKMAISQK